MNTEQERTDFEAWHQHHHGDRDVYVLDESGEYADKQVQGAFNVWQARAALQSQDREKRLVAAIREAIELLGPEAPLCSGGEYEWNHALRVLREAIDHARRVDGDEE